MLFMTGSVWSHSKEQTSAGRFCTATACSGVHQQAQQVQGRREVPHLRWPTPTMTYGCGEQPSVGTCTLARRRKPKCKVRQRSQVSSAKAYKCTDNGGCPCRASESSCVSAIDGKQDWATDRAQLSFQSPVCRSCAEEATLIRSELPGVLET